MVYLTNIKEEEEQHFVIDPDIWSNKTWNEEVVELGEAYSVLIYTDELLVGMENIFRY